MLISTEALRLATANLQNRVVYAQALCDQNESEISENASDIEDNKNQIATNVLWLEANEQRLIALDEGYDALEAEKVIDRAVIIKMCHQYAYASTLVDECLPILEGLDPMPHRWEWPTESCPEPPALPPFNNTVEKDDKVTSDDSDDD